MSGLLLEPNDLEHELDQELVVDNFAGGGGASHGITLALGRLIAEHTDIPAGVVNVLASSAVEPGVVMTTDPNVDMITFTGRLTR